jgi:hypothetical protein
MRNFRFWIPTIVGIAITPICIFLTSISAGAGHGGYGALFVFYPVPTFTLLLFAGVSPNDAFLAHIVGTIINVVVLGSAFLQFPLYGFILSYARLKESCLLTVIAGMIWIHLSGIVIFSVIAIIMALILRA